MTRLLWAELFPDEFSERLAACPVVYLPLGLCEPHGPVAALGLDLVKAQELCVRAALRFGGIVAPSGGYHIHECGYHARWLEEVIGNVNGCMTAMPPAPVLYFFLYQLRSFFNAGFASAVVVSGHAGGNEDDLRRVAAAFSERFAMAVHVRTDAELAHPHFQGDHAGRFELSQLMYLRPELIDMSRLHANAPRTGLQQTLFALGDSAQLSSAAHGQDIVEAILQNMAALVTPAECTKPARSQITYEAIEALWQTLAGNTWITARPKPSQPAVAATSQWKPFERVP